MLQGNRRVEVFRRRRAAEPGSHGRAQARPAVLCQDQKRRGAVGVGGPRGCCPEEHHGQPGSRGAPPQSRPGTNPLPLCSIPSGLRFTNWFFLSLPCSKADNKVVRNKLAEKIAEERAKALLKSMEKGGGGGGGGGGRKRPAEDSPQPSSVGSGSEAQGGGAPAKKTKKKHGGKEKKKGKKQQ